jgi:GAF domain-containing protein
MLAQTIDKHREDALNKSGEQKFTSQELANINDIAEQDAIVQLEEELQQENKRLKTSLTELSRAMSALYVL